MSCSRGVGRSLLRSFPASESLGFSSSSCRARSFTVCVTVNPIGTAAEVISHMKVGVLSTLCFYVPHTKNNYNHTLSSSNSGFTCETQNWSWFLFLHVLSSELLFFFVNSTLLEEWIILNIAGQHDSSDLCHFVLKHGSWKQTCHIYKLSKN